MSASRGSNWPKRIDRPSGATLRVPTGLSLDIMDRLDGARGKAEEVKGKVGPPRRRDEIDAVLDDLIGFAVRRFEDLLGILFSLFTASLDRHSPHRWLGAAPKVKPLAVG